MKILYWGDGFWPNIGGTETQGLLLLEALQQRGHQCMVVAQKYHLNWEDKEFYQGIPIKKFPFNEMIKNRDLKSLRPIKESLEEIAKEFQPDILYLNTLGNGSAFVFLLFHKIFRASTVLTVHSPYFEEDVYGNKVPLLVEQICSQVDQICCASKWGLSIMEKFLPLHKEKMKMIYYGISGPSIQPVSLPFSPPVILLLGRLSSEKGFEVGIEAFSLLRKSGSNAKLIIAGEGDERPFLEHLIDKLGLREVTQFTGGLTRDEVYAAINRSTFVVMPSHFEGFGLVALEAMQMGRAVIASDVGGLPEIVSHGERGLLVPRQNPVALCLAMQDLLDVPEETVQMGKRAREWALKTYLLKENVDQYEALFEECLSAFSK